MQPIRHRQTSLAQHLVDQVFAPTDDEVAADREHPGQQAERLKTAIH